MSQFNSNQPFPCGKCRLDVNGRETRYTDKQGDIIIECVWICPECGTLVRRDDDVIKKQQPPNEPKK